MTLEEAELIVKEADERISRENQARAIVKRERERSLCKKGNHMYLGARGTWQSYCDWCGIPRK